MCGRYTLRTPLNVLLEQFRTGLPPLQLALRYNVAPTQDVPVVRLHEGQRELTTMRWGLVPSWAKDLKVGFSGINARADSIATKPAFRNAFKRRRCLVLADGYYEWQAQGKIKQPYLYEIDGGRPFAFAGLWEIWRGPDHAGPPLESCAIITTEPNDLARQMHDRMPAILDPADYDAWLDPQQQDVQGLLDAFPAHRMTVRPVSTFVNNAKNEGVECVA